MRSSVCKPINPLVDRFFQKNIASINSSLVDDFYLIYGIQKAQIRHNKAAIAKLTDSYESRANNPAGNSKS